MAAKLPIVYDGLSTEELELRKIKYDFSIGKEYADMLDANSHDSNYLENIRSRFNHHNIADWPYEACLDINRVSQIYQNTCRENFIKYMRIEKNIKINDNGGRNAIDTFPMALLQIMNPKDREKCRDWADIFKFVCVQYDNEEYEDIDTLREYANKYKRRVEVWQDPDWKLKCFCGQKNIKYVYFIEALTPFENGKIRGGFFGSRCIKNNAKTSILQWMKDDNIIPTTKIVGVLKKKTDAKKDGKIIIMIAGDYKKKIKELSSTSMTITEQEEKRKDYELKIKAIENLARITANPKDFEHTEENTQEKLLIAKKRIKKQITENVTKYNIMKSIKELQGDDFWDDKEREDIIKALWWSVERDYRKEFMDLNVELVEAYLYNCMGVEDITKEIRKFRNKIIKCIKSFPEVNKTKIKNYLDIYINETNIKDKIRILQEEEERQRAIRKEEERQRVIKEEVSRRLREAKEEERQIAIREEEERLREKERWRLKMEERKRKQLIKDKSKMLEKNRQEQEKKKEKIKIIRDKLPKTYRNKPVLAQYPATTKINDPSNLHNYLEDSHTYNDVIHICDYEYILLKNPINTQVNRCINYFKKMTNHDVYYEPNDEIKKLREDISELKFDESIICRSIKNNAPREMWDSWCSDVGLSITDY